MNDTMYQRELLEHFRYSPHRGQIVDATHRFATDNPACGDRISIELKIAGGIILDMKFVGSGCIISQASASVLAGYMIGKHVDLLRDMTGNDLVALLKILLGPNRTRCATLALSVAQLALDCSINSL